MIKDFIKNNKIIFLIAIIALVIPFPFCPKFSCDAPPGALCPQVMPQCRLYPIIVTFGISIFAQSSIHSIEIYIISILIYYIVTFWVLFFLFNLYKIIKKKFFERILE